MQRNRLTRNNAGYIYSHTVYIYIYIHTCGPLWDRARTVKHDTCTAEDIVIVVLQRQVVDVGTDSLPLRLRIRIPYKEIRLEKLKPNSKWLRDAL